MLTKFELFIHSLYPFPAKDINHTKVLICSIKSKQYESICLHKYIHQNTKKKHDLEGALVTYQTIQMTLKLFLTQNTLVNSNQMVYYT